MRVTLADDTGSLTMIKHVATPEKREELLHAIRNWQTGTTDGEGAAFLMMLNAFLAPLVAADERAAEDPTAE